MTAVFKRELRAYMNNVYGYLFMSVILMFIGIMVFYWNLGYGYTNIEYALLNGEYVLLFMIPVLCMRSMSEDKRNKTDMFYLSLPMNTSSVVLGKYFAMLTVLAIPCAVLGAYPLLLCGLGEVNLGVAYLALLQFFLLGAALLALCQFTSSLSENLVVVTVLGVLASVALLFLPALVYNILPITPMASFIGLVIAALLVGGVAFLTTKNLNVTAITCAVGVVPLSVIYILSKDSFEGLLTKLLNFISPFIHFATFCEYGTLSIPSLVLLLSYPVFFLFLTVQSADKKRWD